MKKFKKWSMIALITLAIAILLKNLYDNKNKKKEQDYKQNYN